MAGIGFELRRLGRRDDLLGPMAAIVHAAIVAAGPWLYTVLVILMISEVTRGVIGEEELATFRVLLVYVFSISLVATTPVTMIGTRVLADDLFLRRYDDVRALFLLTMLAGSALTLGLGALVFCVVMATSAPVALAGIASAQLVAMVWVALVFCGAMRDYLQVTIGFVLGLAVGTTLAIAAAFCQLGAVAMMLGFALGFLVVFVCLTARFMATFTAPCRALGPVTARVVQRVRISPALALGAFASGLSVWIDKWVMWFSGYGERLDVGLIHAPLYDAPMFIASLTVVPALALFVTSVETTFFENYRTYFRAIDQHATLKTILEKESILRHETVKTLTGIILIQTALCTIVLLTAPAIIEAFGLEFQQLTLFRMGATGALFQFLFMTCSAILIYFDATRLYAALQVAFVACLGVLTVVFSRFDLGLAAAGYMIACIVLGFSALGALLAILRSINHRTFVGSATRSAV